MPTRGLRCGRCAARHDFDDAAAARDARVTFACACGQPFRGGDAKVAAPMPPGMWVPPPAGPWRDRAHLVVGAESRFAHRCAECAAEVDTLAVCTLRHLPQHRGGLSLPGLEWAAAANAVLRNSERVRVRVGHCPRHTRLIHPPILAAAFGIAGVTLALVDLAAMAWAARPFPIVGGCFLASAAFFVFALIAAAWPGQLRVVRIDGYNRAWVAGFGDAYLDTIPPLPEAPGR